MRKNGTPGRIRTPNLMVRSHAIYPVDLRAHPEKGRAPCQTSPNLASGFSIQPKILAYPKNKPALPARLNAWH